MGYFFAAIIILLGLLKPDSKIVTAIMLAYMWILIALNNGTLDYAAYEEMFLCCFEPRYALHEPGFLTLCKLCLTLGMSFEQFRMIVAMITIFFMWRGLYFFTTKINYVLSLLLIFPFIGNVSGLRIAVASWIVVFACRFLVSEKRMAGLKYCIFILIATLFHYSSIFALVMLVARNKKIGASSICFIELLCLPILLIANASGLLLGIVGVFTKSGKVLYWFQPQMPRISLTYLVAAALFGALAYLLYRSIIFACTVCNDERHISELKHKYTIIQKINALSLLAFGGAIFSNHASFLRILTTFLPLSYCMIVDSSVVGKELRLHFKLYEILLIGLCVFAAIFVFSFWITRGDALFGAFVHNHLIDRFI